MRNPEPSYTCAANPWVVGKGHESNSSYSRGPCASVTQPKILQSHLIKTSHQALLSQLTAAYPAICTGCNGKSSSIGSDHRGPCQVGQWNGASLLFLHFGAFCSTQDSSGCNSRCVCEVEGGGNRT